MRWVYDEINLWGNVQIDRWGGGKGFLQKATIREDDELYREENPKPAMRKKKLFLRLRRLIIFGDKEKKKKLLSRPTPLSLPLLTKICLDEKQIIWVSLK